MARRWVVAVALVVGLAVAVPPAQVVAVRWVDPPFTATMWSRAREAAGVWPAYDWRDLDDLGPHGPRALVAAEDGRFWYHHGIDPTAVRQALDDRAEGGPLRGASTITQQVARNVFLWQGRSWLRKGLEVVYTVWLDLLVPKARVLELYANVAETGPAQFGLEAGARHWFGKPAKALTAEEAARIAAILPSPRKWRATGDFARDKAQRILARRVPFPGEPGFDRLGAQVADEVGWRAWWADGAR